MQEINYLRFELNSKVSIILAQRKKTENKRFGSETKVLNYLKTLAPVRKLTQKLLTHKLVMSLSLLSAQRGQTLHLLDVIFMDLTFSKVTFKIMDLVKQIRPGYHLKDIVLTGYAPDRRLCIVTILKEYLSHTLDIHVNPLYQTSLSKITIKLRLLCKSCLI